MKTSNHNNGPWAIEFPGAEGAFYIYDNSTGKNSAYIAKTIPGQVNVNDELANALLISAAPDMLKALELAKEWLDPDLCLYEGQHEHDVQLFHNAHDALLSAISKAKG